MKKSVKSVTVFDPMAALKTQLAETPSCKEDLVNWIPLAARMAVLGNPEYLNMLPDLFKQFGLTPKQLLKLVRDRAAEGMHDLEAAEGIFLGLAATDVQDWSFLNLLQPQPTWINPKIRCAILDWVYHSEEMWPRLDVEAGRMTAEYQHAFQVPQQYLLYIVDTPPEEVLLAAALAAEEAARVNIALVSSVIRWHSFGGIFLARAEILFDKNKINFTVTGRDDEPLVPLFGLGRKFQICGRQFRHRFGTTTTIKAPDQTFLRRLVAGKRLVSLGKWWKPLP